MKGRGSHFKLPRPFISVISETRSLTLAVPSASSHAQNLVLLRLGEFVNLADVVVRELLNLGQRVALRVFGNLPLLEHLLQAGVGVAADVSYRRPVFLGDIVNLLG